mmetsp:Transcript_126884/g.371023  ORF Transcript_126884/g.371023 Transcript_126884/m.371023 type:complete len:360 (-) Transcript_126884:200-1279(-)
MRAEEAGNRSSQDEDREAGRPEAIPVEEPLRQPSDRVAKVAPHPVGAVHGGAARRGEVCRDGGRQRREGASDTCSDQAGRQHDARHADRGRPGLPQEQREAEDQQGQGRGRDQARAAAVDGGAGAEHGKDLGRGVAGLDVANLRVAEAALPGPHDHGSPHEAGGRVHGEARDGAQRLRQRSAARRARMRAPWTSLLILHRDGLLCLDPRPRVPRNCKHSNAHADDDCQVIDSSLFIARLRHQLRCHARCGGARGISNGIAEGTCHAAASRAEDVHQGDDVHAPGQALLHAQKRVCQVLDERRAQADAQQQHRHDDDPAQPAQHARVLPAPSVRQDTPKLAADGLCNAKEDQEVGLATAV